MTTASPSPPPLRKPAISGGERQKAYRAKRQIAAVDLSGGTAAELRALAAERGETLDQVVGAALAALRAAGRTRQSAGKRTGPLLRRPEARHAALGDATPVSIVPSNEPKVSQLELGFESPPKVGKIKKR